MRVSDLTRSSQFRLALTLTGLFLAAYTVAAIFTLRTLHIDLDEGVVEEVEVTTTGLAGIYRSGDRESLVAAIKVREATADSEDEVIWLGTKAGQWIAGSALVAPLRLEPGDVTGSVLGADIDDRYRVAVRNIDNLRLVVALSYEESDEIGETVQSTFGWATIFVVFLAVTAATLLAERGQRRIRAVESTLQTVSRGEMAARVTVTSAGDDFDRLSEGINLALGQLETTVDGIRQVSTNIAHDLRTPINRLGILFERIRAEVEDDPVFEDQLAEVADEIRRISNTFDSLLRIAQIETGACKAKFEAVSLSNVALALYDTYLPVAEEQGRSLVLASLPEKGACVHGDRELLIQLFANLIENSIHHCPRGATVRLGVTVTPRSVSMSVSDDGPGIPTEEQENVLRRFYRLDKSRHTAGAGLGLAIVKAIADLHDAVLSLGTDGPGLVVRLEFPCCHEGPTNTCGPA